VTFNYVKAFADYINNFIFGKSVTFNVPKEFEAITPALLQRVWEVDNEKDAVLWEMGNQGGVSGDCFVKVAYEPPAMVPQDEEGNPIPDVPQHLEPGKVKIIPLNSAYCFPEWHPHDKYRLLRFKLKYKFWGTSLEGTRQVFTYTEIITDTSIEEYINDEIIEGSPRPNPLGVIPIVHIANVPVSGSPWGLSDINDIIPLNREYNEKASEISDIINYHSAPVTIVTGAKLGNLEKGARKVWGGLPKDANVFTLENNVKLSDPMDYLELLKRGMHELTGVPETALGQVQPVSNTSGVALAIMYQPLMQRAHLKQVQYGLGIRKINEYVMRTLWVFEPETFTYNPDTEGILDPDVNTSQLDPNDPLTYFSETNWPEPLPVDKMIKLQEIQAKFLLEIESKRGALRDLGEKYPDEKLQEINEERFQEAKDKAALNLYNAQSASMIMNQTGIIPGEQPEQADPLEVGPGQQLPKQDGVPPLADMNDMSAQALKEKHEELVVNAYHPRPAIRRPPTQSNNP